MIPGDRVLITGGAGFLGSHLAEACIERGALVTVVDDLSGGFRTNLTPIIHRIKFREFDLARDDIRGLLREGRFTHILHTAAQAYIPASVERPAVDFEKNVQGTFALLEAMRSVSPDTMLLHTSSAAIYKPGELLDEASPKEPVSPYGASKLACDVYASLYARLYNLRVAILRLFPCYGPRLRKQVVFDLFMKLRRDPTRLPLLGDGTQIRDLNYISNVVDAFFSVLQESAFAGEAYNVGAEEPVTIRELAAMLAERRGISPEIQTSPSPAGDTLSMRANIERLKELGYTPRVRLAEGLDRTVQWLQAEVRNEPQA